METTTNEATKASHQVYGVEVRLETGEIVISRFFTRIDAARRWTRRLAHMRHVLSSRIMRGGAGGEEARP